MSAYEKGVVNNFFIATDTSETLKKKNQKKIDKQKSCAELKLAGFCWLTKFVHPVTMEPKVKGGWYSGLWTLIGPILAY